jgi:GH24 family phage-related lysozyme (muramidase)
MRISFEQYHQFSAPLEGRVPKMYCDVFGYITTGVGNLINTLPEALALPWLLADGSEASPVDIKADFDLCRANATAWAKLKWTVYAKHLRCHLAEEAIDDLVKRVLAKNEEYYRKRWPNYDDAFPADAQLAINSMGWALGPAFYVKFSNLARCIEREDWAGAAASCKIRDGLDTPQKSDDNLGIVPRNQHNKLLFTNAQTVKEQHLDPAVLYWPNVARAPEAKPEPSPEAPAKSGLTAEYLRVTEERPGAGRALLEYEQAGLVDEPTRRDTDVSELAPVSEGGRS